MKMIHETNKSSSIIFILGIIIPFIGISPIITEILATKNWVFVNGEITKANLEKTTVHSNRSRTVYYSDIEYEYYVNDEKYMGNKIGIVRLSLGNKAFAEKLLKKYNVGTIVTVYYNQDNFEDSLLERLSITTVISILFLSSLIIICFIKLYKNYIKNW